MSKIQMEVIPEPNPSSMPILELTNPQFGSTDPYAVMRGNGNTDYVCGSCRVTIAARLNRGQIVNLVFKCKNCGAYNIVRGT